MSLSFTKFNCLANDIMTGVHNLQSDTVKAALTNTLPVASQTVFDPITNHPPQPQQTGTPRGWPWNSTFWHRRTLEQTIHFQNPDTRITYARFIEIKKRKK